MVCFTSGRARHSLDPQRGSDDQADEAGERPQHPGLWEAPESRSEDAAELIFLFSIRKVAEGLCLFVAALRTSLERMSLNRRQLKLIVHCSKHS